MCVCKQMRAEDSVCIWALVSACVCVLIVAVAGMTKLLLGRSWEDSPVSHHHISWN